MEIKKKQFLGVFWALAGVLGLSMFSALFVPLPAERFSFAKDCFLWSSGAITTLFVHSNQGGGGESREDVSDSATESGRESGVEESSNG